MARDLPSVYPPLDSGDHGLGFRHATMRHQPARALGNPDSHEKNDGADHGADQEGKPPAVFGMQNGRVQHDDRAGRSRRRAEPEAAVDQEVGPAAHPRGDEFLNCGIDGRVFAADARASQEPEQPEAVNVPRKRGHPGGEEIDRERDEKQLLAAEPIGEPAKKNAPSTAPTR